MVEYVGIDTGTRLLGWAIVGERGEYINTGWVDLETPLSKTLKGWRSLYVRLISLSNWASQFFADLARKAPIHDQIEFVGIEHPWVGKGRQTALTLGMAWGIIAQAAMHEGYSIAKIEPTQAKKALTGSGVARKPAMLEAAKLMGAKCEGKGQFDEADALGVALATRVRATME